MKITFIFLLFSISFSCVDEEEKNSGYNCDNGSCLATFNNPTYLTLQDCQSICGTSGTTTNPTQPKTGAVSITLSWSNSSYTYTTDKVIIGLGYTSTDVTNGAYFEQKTYYTPSTYTKNNLNAGTYYYKATRTWICSSP